MFSFFQLAAILKRADAVRLLKVPLERSLQVNLAEDWERQYDEFAGNVDDIPFDAGYKPESSERFSLSDYDLPEGFAGESTGTAAKLVSLGRVQNNRFVTSIDGLVGFAQDDQGYERVMFQNFTRGRVIRPGRTLFLSNDTYGSIDQPGLNLDGRLSAVYQPDEQKLNSFQVFAPSIHFCPIMDIYRDASEQEIREVLEHPIFAPEDMDALAMNR